MYCKSSGFAILVLDRLTASPVIQQLLAPFHLGYSSGVAVGDRTRTSSVCSSSSAA